MTAPTVSIIIPTFNRAKFLPRALESVRAQSVDDWEIVLVDDGSTDDTENLATAYGRTLGSRLVYHRQENQGVSAARNRSLELSRGRFIAFLDSDDEYLPTKLERQLKLFELRPELGLVYSDYAYVDLAQERHPSALDTCHALARKIPCERVTSGLFVCPENLLNWLLREYFIATLVGMVRREVLGDEIRFPVELSYAEEWLFYLQVVHRCPAGFVDEPLAVHHHQPGSLARTDTHRNTLRLRQLLEAIPGVLPDLTHPQQRQLRRRWAAASRQLGYDAFRAGRFGEAQQYLKDALRGAPSARGLYDLAHAALCRRARSARAPVSPADQLNSSARSSDKPMTPGRAPVR